MSGLIYSKHSSKYNELCQQSQLPIHDYHCLSDSTSLSTLSEADKHGIKWILAEPTLMMNALHLFPNLEWVQSTWAGVERILGTEIRKDYVLTNIRDTFGSLMSEYLLTYILAHERELDAHRLAKADKCWHNINPGVLRGRTVLLFGAGSIGQEIARTLQFMGVHVLAVVNQPRSIEHVNEVFGLSDCDMAIARADYVVNILPNTPQTQNIFDAAFFAKMAQHALFINVGRGQAVVEADLSQALHRKGIAGAVLDVYQTEPLPEHHVFWDTPNLILTSHTAAPSFPEAVFQIFEHNYGLFTQGLPLKYVVDFERGY